MDMAVAGRAAHPVPSMRRPVSVSGNHAARDHAARVLPAAVPVARSAGTPVSRAGDGDACVSPGAASGLDLGRQAGGRAAWPAEPCRGIHR